MGEALGAIVGSVVTTVIEGIKAGKSNAEIREAVARSEVVSDAALKKVREAEGKVEDFIRNG